MQRKLHYLLLVCSLFLLTGTANVAARSPKQVFAYYFGWHTGVSWQDSRLIDQPQVRYDSRERWAIDRHIQLAQSTGIDAFIMSWFGRNDNNITFPAFETLLDASAAHGFKA